MPEGRNTSPVSGEKVRRAATLVFATAALFFYSGVPVTPGHMFGVPPDARVLVLPREIQPLDRLSGKAFAPATPQKMELPFRKPDREPYPGPERAPEFFPGGIDTLRIPEPRLPEEWTEKPDAYPEIFPPISRRPDNRVSLKEEMVTLGDLDTGKTGGMVRWKDRGRKRLDGFLDIPMVWAEDMVKPYMVNVFEPYRSDPSQAGAAIRLAEAVNRHTGISAVAGPHLFLSSPRISGMPFLFFGADRSFELTDAERLNLGKYLRNGGFIFLDNSAPATEWGPGEASLKQMVRDALGADARFLSIPRSHPLYHCYFDFTDGPPNGMEIDGFNWPAILTSGTDYSNVRMTKPVPYLEGVLLEGELVAVFSNKGYTQKWNSLSANNEPQLKMGVNLVVYALTREGGMNRRNMEEFRIGD